MVCAEYVPEFVGMLLYLSILFFKKVEWKEASVLKELKRFDFFFIKMPLYLFTSLKMTLEIWVYNQFKYLIESNNLIYIFNILFIVIFGRRTGPIFMVGKILSISDFINSK